MKCVIFSPLPGFFVLGVCVWFQRTECVCVMLALSFFMKGRGQDASDPTIACSEREAVW